MNLLMLFVALHCQLLPMLFHYAGVSEGVTAESSLQLSRAASIIMVIAYFAYLVFQLWTHRQLFEDQDVSFLWFWNDEANVDFSSCQYVIVIVIMHLAAKWRRGWHWFRWSSDRILEWMCLAGWDHCYHCSAFWICGGNNWGNWLFFSFLRDGNKLYFDNNTWVYFTNCKFTHFYYAN